VVHYKNQRGSAGEKLVEIFFMMKGIPCFSPSATNSNRDLMIQIDDNFYGVQVKSAYNAFKEERRNFERYKFNFVSKGKKQYDKDVCQIFALVCLRSNYIYFSKNKGQKNKSINVIDYCEELQEQTYEQLLKDLKE
jgi:hypothetical protein